MDSNKLLEALHQVSQDLCHILLTPKGPFQEAHVLVKRSLLKEILASVNKAIEETK